MRRRGRFFLIFMAPRTAGSCSTKPGEAVALTTISAPGSTTGIASRLTTRTTALPAREASASARSRFLAAIVNCETPESMRWQIERPAISPDPTRSARLCPRLPSTFEARLTAA